MKTKFKALLLLFAVFLLASAFYFTEEKENPRNEQTVPGDMMFVPATDSLMNFYIGKTEETNYNWQVYTAWLKNVYIDFPQIYKLALPRDTVEGLWQYYNDPMLNHYSTHAAYQNYPVTGVSWIQIQNYLVWKTDRLNEMILIHNGILDPDFTQTDENNFNTEAYINEQYEGRWNQKNKKKLLDPVSKKKRVMKPSDGILFPEFRLPTEEEWEAAFNHSNVKKGTQRLTDGNYYLDSWAMRYAITSDKAKGRSADPSTSGFTEGVMEWLLDREGTIPAMKESSHEKLLRNGYKPFNFYNDVFVGEEIREKDSLGMMRFIYTGVNNIGEPIYVSRIASRMSPNMISRLNPFYGKDSLLEAWCKTAEGVCSRKPGQPGVIYSGFLDGYYCRFSSRDSLYTVTPLMHVSYEYAKRKIKTGSFRKASHAVEYKDQNDSDPFLGFRTVLPSTGVACPKKYKVKW